MSRFRAAAAIGAAVLALAGTPGAAVAAPAANVVEISSSDTGFTAPATARPGIAAFRARTSSDAAGWIGLARLNPGVTWETFRAALAKTVSDTPADVVSGSAELAASATLLGGVVIHPGMPGAFTQRLSPGTYLLFDYRFLTPAESRYRYLTVSGTPAHSPLGFTGTLTATETADGTPRLTLTGAARAGQPLLVRNNRDGQLVETVLFPIADDVTDAQLAAWFAAFQDGDPSFPPGAPFDISLGRGLLPLSPGHSAEVGVPLTAGRYVAVNWLKDAQTGTRLVKQGDYLVISIH
jgi:hypothetical protein